MSLTIIAGGQRSGKSSYAQKLAESLCENPLIIATARYWDDDFTQRIHRHQADRGPHWQTVEADKHLAEVDVTAPVVLVDCVTLWLTNIFHDCDFNIDKALEEAKREWELFVPKHRHLIVITNEIGMTIHAATDLSRRFIDLHGWINQHIASGANEVFFMALGVPVKIK